MRNVFLVVLGVEGGANDSIDCSQLLLLFLVLVLYTAQSLDLHSLLFDLILFS